MGVGSRPAKHSTRHPALIKDSLTPMNFNLNPSLAGLGNFTNELKTIFLKLNIKYYVHKYLNY